MKLPSLRKGLLRHPFVDQVLVYDTTQDRIHLMDGTTAAVFDSLEKGDAAADIVARLCLQNGTDNGSALLALALDELAKAELTEVSADGSVPMPEITRRHMLGRFAGIGAAVLIPAIVSLTPNPPGPRAAHCNVVLLARQPPHAPEPLVRHVIAARSAV